MNVLKLTSFISFTTYLIDSCSNIIITPGASNDKSSIIAYNADSAGLYGSLYYYPSKDYNKDTI